MTLTVRALSARDLPSLHALYKTLLKSVPLQRAPRLEQFQAQLSCSRLFPNPAHFQESAEIGLVAEQGGRLLAYANGCLFEGDYVVPAGGYIRALLVQPGERKAAAEVLNGVLSHLETFNPPFIQLFSGGMGPMPTGFTFSFLPGAWSWLGATLMELGFEVHNNHIRLARDLTKPLPKAQLDGYRIETGETIVKGELAGLAPKYNIGYRLLKGDQPAGWCGQFYGGAFLRGAGFESVFTHWFTVHEEFLGRGLGRSLLRHALHEARHKGAKVAHLITDLDNFKALALYRSEGYEPIDTGPSFQLVRGRRAFLKGEDLVHNNQTRELRKHLRKHPEVATAHRPTLEATDSPTLLHLLAQSDGDPQGAKLLLEAGCPVDALESEASGQTALEMAVEAGATALVPCLLKAGAVQKPGLLEQALGKGKLQLAGLLLEAGSALSVEAAAGLGDTEYVQSRWSETPKKKQQTALHLACRNGQSEVIQYLLEEGLDPNLLHTDGDGFSFSALHRAAVAGNLEIIRLLIDSGADHTLKDTRYDCPAREWAQWWGHGDVVAYLDSL